MTLDERGEGCVIMTAGKLLDQISIGQSVAGRSADDPVNMPQDAVELTGFHSEFSERLVPNNEWPQGQKAANFFEQQNKDLTAAFFYD